MPLPFEAILESRTLAMSEEGTPEALTITRRPLVDPSIAGVVPPAIEETLGGVKGRELTVTVTSDALRGYGDNLTRTIGISRKRGEGSVDLSITDTLVVRRQDSGRPLGIEVVLLNEERTRAKQARQVRARSPKPKRKPKPKQVPLGMYVEG